MNIILLATAWGPKAGGVNAFNEDFALGLASYHTDESKTVFCLVPSCEPSDIASAATGAVHLVEIPEADDTSRPFDAIAATLLRQHPKLPAIGPRDIWVGHDVLTGLAAKEAARASGSKSALIMHMNHEAYVGARDNDSHKGHQRYKDQQDLFLGADYHFAVGPLLRDALSDMIGRDANMLVPGMPEIVPNTARNQLRCVAFGRLEARNDLVKQVSLASAGFARAQGKMRECEDLKSFNCLLKLYGVPKYEERDLLKLADDRAHGIANVLALPYEESREELFDVLARANLAIVPSFHDGFALTGWEAIAAETPLIVGENTGLWLLLANIWSPGFATTVVNSIRVHGARSIDQEHPFTEDDESTLAALIVEAARNLETRLRMAGELKHLLQQKRDGCTWKKTAEEFLVGVKFIENPEMIQKSFEGAWIGFFIEGSTVARPPEVLREKITIRSRAASNDLEGNSEYVAAEGARKEKLILEVHHGILSGQTSVIKGETQESRGRFQLAPRGEGRLLDGIATWPSTIKPEIDSSRYIWVRDEVGNEELIALAERAMEVEQTAVMNRIEQRSADPVTLERFGTISAA